MAGKYKFKQRGDIPFVTRILGGVTQSPRPNTYCKENISDLSVCDTEQKELWIDENYCLSVDYNGRPVDIYSETDMFRALQSFLCEKFELISWFIFQVILTIK